eukprot:6371423-Pyramimonas_sp.AAC.1
MEEGRNGGGGAKRTTTTTTSRPYAPPPPRSGRVSLRSRSAALAADMWVCGAWLSAGGSRRKV